MPPEIQQQQQQRYQTEMSCTTIVLVGRRIATES